MLKKSIIKKLKSLGADLRAMEEYNEHGWTLISVWGKLRCIHKVTYHFEEYSLYIDDVEFSTVN